jgi:hypothetical protein
LLKPGDSMTRWPNLDAGESGCCAGTTLLLTLGLSLWAAATPSWFVFYPATVYSGVCSFAVSGPFVLSHVGDWSTVVSADGQPRMTSTAWTSWKDAAGLAPCSNTTVNDGLAMLSWGLEFGICDAAGTFLGTPTAILALQIMLYITAIFVFFAMIASFSISSDGRGKRLVVSLCCTSIALASSVSAVCIALTAVPWYASLRGNRPVLPVTVLSLATGATSLYPLHVPEHLNLGVGVGCTAAVAGLCFMVLAGLVVVATRGSRDWR